MIHRIYVEKKEGFDVARRKTLSDVRNVLGIDAGNMRYLLRYDVEGLSDEDFQKSVSVVFSEPPVDRVFDSVDFSGKTVIKNRIIT